MKAFLEFVVKALVDFPDQVEVRELDGDRTMVYELRLNKSDIGKVIGKQGRTIQSIRTLVRSACAKNRKRAMVEIVEDQETKREEASSSELSSDTPSTP